MRPHKKPPAREMLYERLARSIEEAVSSGALLPGDRVPSVRSLSEQKRVSISTVLDAYRLLENRGVIEARPQSGFYVRRAGPALPLPKTEYIPSRPTPVHLSDVLERLAQHVADPNVVPLGNADPQPLFFPVAAMQRRLARVIRESPSCWYQYTLPQGEPSLRRQIARRMATLGCSLSPDEIIVTNGAFEAINLCLRSICRPGDTVAVESPVHFILLQMLEALGLKALEIPVCTEEGMDLEVLDQELRRHSRVSAVLVQTNFSNPTGGTLPEEKKRRLVQIAERHSVWVIEDDVYGDLHFGATRPGIARAYDRSKKVLYCSSFSKTLCPGLRVGWVVPGTLGPVLLQQKYVNNYCSSALQQRAVATFLEDGSFDRQLRRARRAYESNMRAALDLIARHFPSGTTVSRPRGGLVLWVGLPPDVCGREMFEHGVRAGISLTPGEVFSAQGLYRNFIRLVYCVSFGERERSAIKTLGALARSLTRVS